MCVSKRMSTGEITEKEGFVTDTANEFWHFLKKENQYHSGFLFNITYFLIVTVFMLYRSKKSNL